MFRELKAEVVALSYDPVEALSKYKAKKQAPFHLVADADRVVIDRYDLKNTWEPIHRGAPHPSAYIIDQMGIVRFADVRQNYLWRTKIGTILEELKKLEGNYPGP
jgi:peroxiredoxin